MVRISKQAKRRQVSPKRTKAPSSKTGPKQDALPKGFKFHENGVGEGLNEKLYIPKIKSVKS